MKIKINGVIGFDITPLEIAEQLKDATGDLIIEINSQGGSVFDGVEIHNMLTAYEGKKIVRVTSLAASIASYIMLAGDEIEVFDNSTVMIHNAWGVEMGDHRAMNKYGMHLEALSEMIAIGYANKTGKDLESIKEMMNEETWLYGDEIQTNGFADKTLTTKKLPNKAAALAIAQRAFMKCNDKVKEYAQAEQQEPMKQFENGLANQKKEDNMQQTASVETTTHDASAEMQAQINTLMKEKMEAERKTEIMSLAMEYNVNNELKEKFVKEGTPQDFTRAILDTKKETVVNASVSDDNYHTRKDMAIAALAMRAGVKTPNASREVHQMASMSITEIVKNVSENYNMTKTQLASYAMSTSDFPSILAGVTNKIMADSFEQAATTYKLWCQEADIQDFKEVSEVSLSQMGTLSKKAEGGEPKRKNLKDGAEKWRIETYSGRLAMSREMIVNDDMGAFADIVTRMSDAAARTANELAYSVLTNNAVMSDSVALFHATHGNYTGTGTAISHASLAAARAMMRKQKDVNGVALNVAPAYIIVSPDKETEALQFVTTALLQGSTDGFAGTNTFAGTLQVVVDATLTGNSWYLAANRNTVKVGYLAGTGRMPIIEERERSTVDGIIYDVVYDIGAVATDYRGLYKNMGA